MGGNNLKDAWRQKFMNICINWKFEIKTFISEWNDDWKAKLREILGGIIGLAVWFMILVWGIPVFDRSIKSWMFPTAPTHIIPASHLTQPPPSYGTQPSKSATLGPNDYVIVLYVKEGRKQIEYSIDPKTVIGSREKRRLWAHAITEINNKNTSDNLRYIEVNCDKMELKILEEATEKINSKNYTFFRTYNYDKADIVYPLPGTPAMATYSEACRTVYD